MDTSTTIHTTQSTDRRVLATTDNYFNTNNNKVFFMYIRLNYQLVHSPNSTFNGFSVKTSLAVRKDMALYIAYI